MTTWTLLDYGVGNLHSLRKALEAAGAKTQTTQDPHELAKADVAVLPGVGAFGHVMDSVAPARDALRARHEEGAPVFGVCIGQQILYEGSEESPDTPGLGILPGTVRRLPADAGKIPHMGWSQLDDCLGVAEGLTGQHVYYVHSYAAPVHEGTIARTEYGMPFSAAVHVGNTVATQFHPEKSSNVGRRFLQRVVAALEAA